MCQSFQRLWTCLQGFGKLSRPSEPSVDVSRHVKVGEDHVEAYLDQMINEVLHTEVGKLQTTFSQHLREYEVALSQFRPENELERSWARRDVELLRQQVQLMERQRRQRNLEVGKLRKAMKEVRNALFVETPAAAQGHLAAQQLLDEVRTERERRLAEKRYLEEQIKKLKSEIEELEEGQAATPAFDHEKEKLKASVRQLKMSIESKDRYACWVCNRAHERQDESAEGSDAGEDSDKHDECVMMRRRLVEMEEEIRELTGEGGPGAETFEPAQASQSRPSARLSHEPPSVTESTLSPTSTLRSSRDRMPTPWAQASTVAEASVQFSDSVSAVTSLEVPENVPEVGNRSVRDRILTPFVAANVTASEDRRALLAPVLSTVEEFEAQSSRERLRSSRDRMPTPHVSSEMIEETETYASSGKTVRIFPAADMEAIPASGRRRPSRERQATPFVKEEDMPPNDTRTVQFSGAVSTEAIPASGRRRPSRERQATPFVKEEDVPPNDTRTVQFSAAVSTEAIPGSGGKRSSRERQATPFVKEEDVPNNVRTVQFSGAVTSEASVQFSDTVSIASGALELPETVPEVGNRSVRDHITTPYAPAAALSEDRRVLLAPVSTVEEFEVQGSGRTFRSSRDRMPTPYVSTEMEEDTPADAVAKTVRILRAAEIQAIPASGHRRSSRDRQATPFVKEDAPDDMRTVQLNSVVSTEVQPMSQDDVRPTRDRVATPFAQPADEDAHQDRRVALAPVLSVIEEFETDGSVTHFRSSRDRMPTPYMSPQLVEEDAFVNAGKTVRVLPFADAKAIPVSGQCRSSRERQATPFFKEGESVAERTVQFNEVISTEAAAAEGCEVGRRSVHDRIATPYAGNVDPEENRVVVPSDASVEEFEVEGLEAELRSSRDRIPTPHVSSEMVEEAFLNSGKSVRIFPVAEMQAIAASGQRRSSRERQATPFFKEEECEVPDGGQSVSFDETISTEAVLLEPQAGRRPVRERISTPFTSMAFSSFQDRRVQLAPVPTAVEDFEPASQKLRPSRDRMPTPHVSSNMIEETFANFSRTVRVFPAAETEVIHLSGQRRPVRERQATPFFKEDSDFELHSKAVQFNDKVSCETPSKVIAAAQSKVGRSVRDRVATPFAAQTQEFEDHRVLLTPVVSTVEEFEVTGSKFRSSRDRIPTPHVTSEMVQETLSVSPGKTVRVSPAVDVEAIPASGKRRSSRDRQATPFFKEDVVDDTFSQEAAISGIEREISVRVKLNAQRQAREERRVHIGTADANVPLALERCSSADSGNPEADLARHIVARAVKDTELLRNTLRNLAFFETFDDDSLHCLIEAMEVYEFQPGEKVVRQGDTDGTHFFVVAHGEFYIVEDNSKRCYIGPGSSFGESVLLLHGERSATVCSQGCSRAYGMAGMQVRELLRQQYEQMRQSVVEAMDEVLQSNQCEILSGLNGYQLQSLYDQVEMKSFKPGELVLQEGDLPNEVFILFSGEVDSTSGGQKMGKVPRFYLMGDRALLFEDGLAFEQPTSLTAATAVELLVLKRSLLDSLFGSRLQQVLVRNRVLYVLAQHEDFSRLHQEHREAIATACQIRCLPRGSEASWEDVRVIMAVNGEVQLSLATGPQHLLGASSDLYMFGMPNRDLQMPLKLQALADSKIAVWQREDLESILTFHDFDGALEQDSKVRSLRSVFVFSTLSKHQLQRLARALEIETVKCGSRVFAQGDQGTHFYIIRQGAVSVEIDGCQKRRLGHADYFGERALLGNEVRSASITALEDTELWKMGKETFQEMMQGQCLDYLKDRISLQDTALTFKDLEFVRVIGRGGFGVVKMVRAKKTGVRYALKCVRKRDVVEKNMQDALLSELDILKEVDHPFIVKFVRSFRDERSVFFLTELVTGGELLDALDALGLLNHWQALFYTGCIVLALEFLHSRRIAYLDLKSENCLIDQQGYLKMIDFGIARRITKTRYGPLKGTPVFMAPEMVLGKGNSTVADLWSLGICLYEFVVGQFPFASNCSNRGQIFHQILRAPLRFPEWFYKQPMAEETMGLLRGLLSRDPKRRLGAGHEGYAKLKAHPFFKSLCWEKLLCREYDPPYIPASEKYAEDKSQPVNPKSVGKPLPTVEEEEARCAAPEEPWQDPSPGWDMEF